jgi:ribosome biogenesis GTPase
VGEGIVIKSTGSWYTVRDGNKRIDCKIKGSFRKKDIRSTNPVVVGDHVTYIPGDEGTTGLISEIEDRKNYIVRKASKLSKQAHIIAANIDQALLMITIAFPKTTLEFIDRFLVTAEAYHIPVILVFNKTDLYNSQEREEMNAISAMYEKIGYRCLHVAALSKKNIEAVITAMTDKISVIAGNSGVGKSTLINSIEPELQLRTGDISDYHQSGKHTTAHTEMYALGFGGYIIDTPGIKGFGVIDFKEEEVGYFFPEIFKKSKDCQFYNCTHVHEPGCAVKKAVDEGYISPSRYNSYLNILFDKNEKYRLKKY